MLTHLTFNAQRLRNMIKFHEWRHSNRLQDVIAHFRSLLAVRERMKIMISDVMSNIMLFILKTPQSQSI